MLIEPNAGAAIDPEEIDESEDEESEEESETGSKDPLDLIEDEAERNEAKRLRAIAQRRLRKAEEPKVEPEGITSAYATKDDLKKLATNEAKKLVAPEVKAAWDELVAIPLGGFDPMDAESIAKNMAQRFTLHTASQSKNGDPASDLTSSPTIPYSGGSTSSTKPSESKVLPGYRESTPPSEWYK